MVENTIHIAGIFNNDNKTYLPTRTSTLDYETDRNMVINV